MKRVKMSYLFVIFQDELKALIEREHKKIDEANKPQTESKQSSKQNATGTESDQAEASNSSTDSKTLDTKDEQK